ncbi:MAG: hypothetical protein E7000_08720 [Coriobacteriaceae bacterium]|nr:hypothetical protein [Coriobacteriaceae bacterium]
MGDNQIEGTNVGGAAGSTGFAPSDFAGNEAQGRHAAPAYAQAASTVDSVAAYTESAIAEKRKQRAGKKRGLIAAIVAVLAVLAIYVGGVVWFSGHFLPHTQLGSYDVSGMDVDQATAVLEEASDSYAMQVTGEGLDFEVTSSDTGLRIDSNKVVKKAIDANQNLSWPLAFIQQGVQDLSDTMEVTYDKKAFKKFVKNKVKAFNKKASDPTSATIAYDKKENAYAIVPEELGEKLDASAVFKKVQAAGLELRDSVEIGEDELLRPDVLADDERLAKAVDEANSLLGTDIQLMLGGNKWKEVDSDLISKWITLGKDVTPQLDDQALRDWAGAQVGDVNNIGSQREFTTPRGDKVTVTGGSYGWQVDYEPFLEALKAAVHDKTVGELEVPCIQTAASLPDKNGVDFGTRYVDVNISAQHAVFYDGDDVLWESDFISGSPDGEHDTPYGTYMINLKESPSKLVGENVEVVTTSGKGKKKTTSVSYEPEYETEVQYWMPFVGNAIGFHDATWQPDFGGSMYMEGYGSHGCVNLSYDAAEELYGIITAGTPVIVHG